MVEAALTDYSKDSLVTFLWQYIKQVKSLNQVIIDLKNGQTGQE